MYGYAFQRVSSMVMFYCVDFLKICPTFNCIEAASLCVVRKQHSLCSYVIFLIDSSLSLGLTQIFVYLNRQTSLYYNQKSF